MDAKIKPNVKVINLKTNKVVLKTHNALSDAGKSVIANTFKESVPGRMDTSNLFSGPGQSAGDGKSGIGYAKSSGGINPLKTSQSIDGSNDKITYSGTINVGSSSITVDSLELGSNFNSSSNAFGTTLASITSLSLSWDANTPYQVVWEYSFSYTNA